MSLPDSSYLVNVGKLRSIQSLCKLADSRNPDVVVGAFLSIGQRLGCLLRGMLLLLRLRANPAVRDSVACIVNIGCGADTRAYRFAHLLEPKGIMVLECDRPQAIYAQRDIAARRWPTRYVRYVPLELNDAEWSGVARAVDEAPPGRAFVMIESVRAYIGRMQFEAFLRLLAARLRPGSVLAYDFKLEGAARDFGRSAAAPQPFRLAGEADAVAADHHALGFQLQRPEASASLTRRLLPRAPGLFEEDCLACLTC